MFYEKSRTNKSFDPFHRYENVPGPMGWDTEYNVPEFTKAYRYYEKMLDLYQQIDNTGYEELPAPLYEKWLEYVAGEKEKHQKTAKKR